jgi:hypothetical protein
MLRQNQYSIRYLMLIVLLFALAFGLFHQAFFVIGINGPSAPHLIAGTILCGMGVGGLLGDIRGGIVLGILAWTIICLYIPV